MNILKMGPLAMWLYNQLIPLRDINRNIKIAREKGDNEKEREYILKATQKWGKNLMDHAKVDLRVTGRENVPEGAVLFVGNHQSYLDIPVTCAAITNKQFGFIAKKELAKIPKYGEWMLNIRSLFIDRENPRESIRTIEKGISYIRDGFSMVVYPEGTRSKGATPGEFKKGSLKLATKPGVPIVPITISGSYHIFEEKGALKKGQRVDFYIHPPVNTAGISRQEESELNEKIEKIIIDKLMEFNLEKGEITNKQYEEFLMKRGEQ